jgi:hypothetical protein
MDKYIREKFNDETNDNVWLHRIANETAKTNTLLSQLIDLYLEDNPRTKAKMSDNVNPDDESTKQVNENGKRYRLTAAGFKHYY